MAVVEPMVGSRAALVVSPLVFDGKEETSTGGYVVVNLFQLPTKGLAFRRSSHSLPPLPLPHLAMECHQHTGLLWLVSSGNVTLSDYCE